MSLKRLGNSNHLPSLMNLKGFAAAAIFLLLISSVTAQDIHFTQFRMAPLTLNPALVGAFSGSYRLGGLYRDQWSGTYTTPSFYVDSPLTKGLRDQDWIGIGGVFVSDVAGVSSFENDQGRPGTLRRTGFLGTAGYHLGLNKEQTSVLSIGVKVGTVGLKLEDEFLFEDNLFGGASVEQLPTGGPNDQGQSFLDISGGLALSGSAEGGTFYQLGFSVNHIAASEVRILGAGTAGPGGPGPGGPGRRGPKQDMWIIAHGEYGADLTENLLFDVAGLAQFLGSAREIAVQGRIGYRVSEKETIAHVGAGYRFGDSAALLLGLQHKSIRAGLAYDLTLSSLAQPNNALELAVSYIGKIYKRPKIDPVIFCPRF